MLEKEAFRAARFLRERFCLGPAAPTPRIACLAGSGMGAGFFNRLERIDARIAYADIPHMPTPSVAGHPGELVLGRFPAPRGAAADNTPTPVWIFGGRAHIYEGFDPGRATFAVRLALALGARVLILTNAAGALNPTFRVGDFMLIRDCLDLMFRPPRRANGPMAAPRYLERGRARDLFDEALARTAIEAARAESIGLREGVYAAVAGPNYETRAEITMLRALGADAVGMSTAPEAFEARRLGARTLGVSLVTNACGERRGPKASERILSHEEVLQAAARAEEKFSRLLAAVAGAAKKTAPPLQI